METSGLELGDAWGLLGEDLKVLKDETRAHSTLSAVQVLLKTSARRIRDDQELLDEASTLLELTAQDYKVLGGLSDIHPG